MISENTITIIAGVIAMEQRDVMVNRVGESLRASFKGERISKERVQRILDKFVEELKKI
ncbi:hypothetical protein LGL08_20385 [Clostridium estertheticum]|uniref:hypothetical protein n=1 Tax=Clostridium estertheticum TaxID=238834 RepID=UPI001CF40B73|nr:hypothetical protein [Clostridium estertheticum]MCB2308860.1 hypothetical protein [Clostridium estertheticum]MCB2347272.1 hypothetical protein [Clostridium estertheticum]MCB2351887.1 hypothetical protein [Clostridium estertheticum]WAG48475.1 hypothetical protein LL127_23420 [Clostridium estertheticum]